MVSHMTWTLSFRVSCDIIDPEVLGLDFGSMHPVETSNRLRSS